MSVLPRRLRRPVTVLVAILASAIAATLVWALRAPDVSTWGVRERRALEDGWSLVVRVRPPGLFPMPRRPGQSGDRPGSIGVHAPDGRHCGDAPVDMVGMFTLDWDDAEISLGRPRSAVWDKARCEVRFRDLTRR